MSEVQTFPQRKDHIQILEDYYLYIRLSIFLMTVIKREVRLWMRTQFSVEITILAAGFFMTDSRNL